MKILTLVDSNILIDLLGPATPHRPWSVRMLGKCRDEGELVLSPIVWAEIAASVVAEEVLTVAFSWLNMSRENFPFEAAFRAGKAHRAYRLAGGLRERTLPDFLIGAHAEWRRYRLLTRDAARYRSYFPTLDIISPETHP